MHHVRSKYIAAFRKGLAELHTEGIAVHPEVRLEVEIPSTHELYGLRVVDALTREPDGSLKAIRFTTDPIAAVYPGITFDSPIGWHSVTFQCSHRPFLETHLVAWGQRWIHDETPPLGPQDGLTGIIHEVFPPHLTAGHIEFTVDFGSAPFQAFEELVAGLRGDIRATFTHPTEESEA